MKNFKMDDSTKEAIKNGTEILIDVFKKKKQLPFKK